MITITLSRAAVLCLTNALICDLCIRTSIITTTVNQGERQQVKIWHEPYATWHHLLEKHHRKRGFVLRLPSQRMLRSQWFHSYHTSRWCFSLSYSLLRSDLFQWIMYYAKQGWDYSADQRISPFLGSFSALLSLPQNRNNIWGGGGGRLGFVASCKTFFASFWSNRRLNC